LETATSTEGAGAGSWTKVREHTLHTASDELAKPIIPERNNANLECNQDQLGFLVAILAYAASDGKLSVLTFKSERQYPYRLVIFH
jgi:protein transport protein SEC13